MMRVIAEQIRSDTSLDKLAKVLTAKGRQHVKEKNFVFPEDKSYPIHDISHARNALARAAAKGGEIESKVKAKVYSKYPSLRKEASMDRVELVKMAADVLDKAAQSSKQKMEAALDTRGGGGASAQFWFPWLGTGVGKVIGQIATKKTLGGGMLGGTVGFTASSLITQAVNRITQKNKFMKEFGDTEENRRIWEASQKSYNKAYAVRRLWNTLTMGSPIAPVTQLIRPGAGRRQEAISRGMEYLKALKTREREGGR